MRKATTSPRSPVHGRAPFWAPAYVMACLFGLLAAVLTPSILIAGSLDLTVRDVGIGIGDSEVLHGLRLNFRDRELRRVNGINITIWSPPEEVRSDVRGLALGLPLTGGETLRGLGIGAFGVAAERDADGVFLGGLGAGAGERLRGVAIGGLGAGTGDDVIGVLIGGLGAGTGENVRGVLIGGLGAGAGEDVQGIQVGGLGVGAGGNLSGISAAGLATGAGGDVAGIQVAGLAVGAGERMRGIQVAGLAVGAGEALSGVSLAGLAVGAPEARGLLIGGIASGGVEVSGLAFSLAHFRITEEGILKGAAVSAFNRIEGTQRGLTVGLFNMASELEGIQIGLLNYAGNKRKGLRWLPFVNANF